MKYFYYYLCYLLKSVITKCVHKVGKGNYDACFDVRQWIANENQMGYFVK